MMSKRFSRRKQLEKIIENTVLILEAEDEKNSATFGDGSGQEQSGNDIHDFDGNGKKFKGLIKAYQEAIDTGDVVKLVGVLKSAKKNPDIRPAVIKFMKSARYTDEGGAEDDKVTSSSKIIKPSVLSGTQNEIDFHKSVAFPFAGKIGWNISIKKAAGAKVTPNAPVITAGETLVLDGHHRWSSTLAINPDANLDCVDFDFPSNMNKKNMLNALHSAIAAASNNPDGFEGSEAGSDNIGVPDADLNGMFDRACGQPCGDPKLTSHIFCGDTWIEAAKANPLDDNEAAMLGFSSAQDAADKLEQAIGEDKIKDGGWEDCPFRKVVITKVIGNLKTIGPKISQDDPSRLAMPQSDSKSVFGKEGSDIEKMKKVADQLAAGNVHINADFDPEEIKESKIIHRWNQLAGTLLKD